MAAQNVARAVGWAVGCVLAPILLGVMFGPRWIGVGTVIALTSTLWLLFWIPRSAHAAFQAGRFDRAQRRYRVIASLAFTPSRERAAILSRAGCEVAAGRREHAEKILAELDPASFDVAERVVWLNNRACAILDAAGDGVSALAFVDEAVVLRPDVPAIQHTRARALLAIGRIDDAIGVLDSMRAGGELSPRLEAERCKDLATAWEHKGQVEYADDYRERARLVAR